MTVSICIPAHNAESTLAATLDSLVVQTYADLDIAVLDNASIDGTPDIIRRFSQQDGRVRHVRFEELVPPHDNFTRCFSVARGELMAIYHADDVYHPRIVEEEVALLEKRPDIGLIFTRARRVDDAGKPMPAPFPIPDAIFSNGLAVFDFLSALRAVLQYGHIFMTPGGMTRTSIYRDEIKKWPSSEFGGAADLYVFLMVAKVHKLAIIDQELMDYRIANASTSFRYARMRRTRHDMFSALNYFIDNGAGQQLRPRDWSNFDFLKLKDDINLSISCLIDGNSELARKLMPRLLFPRLIAAAFRYRRHLKILMLGYVIWSLSWIMYGQWTRNILKKWRFG